MKRLRRPLEGRSILIVEDDFLVGSDMRLFLQDAGAVGDLADACAAARSETIKGAVLDVRL